MHAEIITIGDEILIGQIVDSNSAWIAQKLNSIGIDVTRIISISDKKKAIFEALENLHEETKLVLMTGGLGPTKDDLTKNVLCDYYKMKLVFNDEVDKHIKKLFASLGRIPSDNNREQAMMPEGCRVLHNDVGTAPGMLFEHDGKFIVSMPGVPYEMKHLIKKQVLPIVSNEILRQHILHKTLLTVGVPESELSEKLEEFEQELPSIVKMAYLPRPGMVRLRLTAKGKNDEELKHAIKLNEEKLKGILGDVVYGSDDDRLEQLVGKLLAERRESLSTAESCTGGYVAHLLTSVPGSSQYFKGSIIAYENRAKHELLGVSEQYLKEFGAVSKQVVIQMAEGARTSLNTTWAIATSGIAGPDGGTDAKPVGTVWIALSGPNGTDAMKFQFGNNRSRNIKKSAFMALDLLRIKLV